MEASEEKYELKNEQLHLDSGSQSDHADPLHNDDKLIHVMSREFEKMAIHETLNRDFSDEECEVKRMIDEEVYNLVMEAVHEDFRVESSSEDGGRETLGMGRFVDEALAWADVKKFIEGESMERRVLEEREVGDNGSGHGKDVKEVDGDDDKNFEHEEDDLEEIHAVNFEGEHGSIEVVDNEYSDEEKRSENGKELENKSGNAGRGESGSVAVPNDGRPKNYHYPLRPDAEDCSYYVRTGMCKFESNCKFNHPLKRRNQPPKETVKPRENSDRPGQIVCKYYLSSGGCKYGKACKYSHSRGRTVVAPAVEYNFLGLPIRLGEQECPYYMRNGSCKYGPNCRFNHPDPTAVGGGDAPSTYGNGGSVQFQNAPQTTMSSWSAPRPLNETAPFVPVLYSPTHGMPPPNSHWNGYQAPAPVYPTSERSLPTPPAFFINNPPSDANLYNTHQMPVSEFPERPGQLECSYYLKTGDCKYRSSCKFHHPRNRIPKTAPSVPSNKGLPFRPDKNICTHYSQYGICKYGPGCKYDHPVYYSNSGGAYQPNGSNEPSIQQSM